LQRRRHPVTIGLVATSPHAASVARNQSLFREVNERIEKFARGSYSPAESEFLCECGRTSCLEAMPVALGDYEAVRSSPRRFLVKPGHEQLDVERVVERRAAYLIVEKSAAGAAIADELDPRGRLRPA
jgi:hypothetical protein